MRNPVCVMRYAYPTSMIPYVRKTDAFSMLKNYHCSATDQSNSERLLEMGLYTFPGLTWDTLAIALKHIEIKISRKIGKHRRGTKEFFEMSCVPSVLSNCFTYTNSRASVLPARFTNVWHHNLDFPHPITVKLTHESLHGAIHVVGYASIRSRTRWRITQTEKWNHRWAFTYCSIFVGWWVTHYANVLRVYGFLA